MKVNFCTVYVLWIISLSLYIWVCSLATNTQDQFLFLVSIGTMVSMLFFCSILVFFAEKLD
ncbi:MAG: hypothetical protein ACXAB8_14115 [Promethearchaeota archaeon]